MKKGLNLKYTLISLLVVIILLLAAIFIKYTFAKNKPLVDKSEKIEICVNKGDSLYGVFEKLKNKGLLKSPLFAKIYLKFNKPSEDIKPGEYVFNSSISLPELIGTLEKGLTVNNKITFPEGYSINDIAEKLNESGLISKDEFINEVKKYPLPVYIKENNNKRYNLEGYLFPDTYSFNKDVTANEVITTMLKRYEEVMQEVQKEVGITINPEDYEKYTTIASMIEKESRIDSDRPLIASVIYNRLEKKMPLQLDATVLYALGKHKDVVYYKDLEVNSPYNTYKVKGLPIGPIASPGKPSLIAAVKPDKTDYLYYLLKDKNKHYFTNDFNDFLNKKRELGY